MCIRDSLNFLLQEKYERRINLGIRFDSEEIASLLVNATADLKTHIPSRLALTGRLGKRYAARIDYTLDVYKRQTKSTQNPARMLDGASYGSHIFIATDAQPFINLPENDILFLSVIRLQNQ